MSRPSSSLAGPGLWCHTGDPLVAETLAACGVAWVCIDMQHGLVSVDSLLSVIHAIEVGGCACLVRVPSSDPAFICSVLDRGAAGVVVPIHSVDEGIAAVEACHYAPVGTRSFATTRSRVRAASPPICLLMVEEPATIAGALELAALPLCDGLFFGPKDAALLLDAPDDDLMRVAAEVVAACRKHGKYSGVFDPTRTFRGVDFDMVCIGADSEIVASAAHRRFNEFVGEK